CDVWDVDGRRYLDFFAGAGALALGHGHPAVVEAVRAQLEVFTHGLDFPSETRDAFVTELLGTMPESMRDYRVHLCAPTGTDAVEAAIKLCKRATGRSGVIAFRGSYHGTTAGALAATSNVELRSRFPSLMPEVHFAAYANCAHCPAKLPRASCGTACAAMFETIFEDDHSGVAAPAAVLMELVQGEGGTIIPPTDFVQRVRQACSRAKAPLVADEIQSGLGRTGKWWAFEHFDIAPDVVLSSKALGGIGLPVAAMAYRPDLDVWEPGSHIGTFRGHHLAFAAGAKAIQVMREEDVLHNARERGAQLLNGLTQLSGAFLRRPRGLGLMVAVDVVHPSDGTGWPELASAIRSAAFEAGLLIELGGRGGAALRFLPPLIVTEAEVTKGLQLLEAAMNRAMGSVGAAA
ncbi:MAG: aspartate aminotransferase family protein, partial [Myxococcaceae bacterium]